MSHTIQTSNTTQLSTLEQDSQHNQETIEYGNTKYELKSKN
jgi:hypothetical protein